MYEFRMHGRGGQGIVVAGEMLANAFLSEKRYFSVFPQFGVERRGSDVTAFGRLSNEPIREKSKSYNPDFLLIFDPSQISRKGTYEGFRTGGVIIACGADPDEILSMGVKPSRIVVVDGMRIAYEVTGNNLTNMIICGAFTRATDMISFDSVISALKENLPKNFIKTSIIGAERGFKESTVFDYKWENEREKRVPRWVDPPLSCKDPLIPEYEAPWGNYEDHYIVLSTGDWRSTRPIFDNESCVKCGICSTYCPPQCIKSDPDERMSADLDFCKGCGICAHECPKNCIEMKLEADYKEAVCK